MSFPFRSAIDCAARNPACDRPDAPASEGCAHYFDIPKLENDIKAKLTALMLDHPYVACAILDESSKLASGEELVRVSIERVRARPKAALLHCNGGAPTEDSANSIGGTAADSTKNGGGVASLSASLLEQVVFDEQSAASELTKFLCLKRWVEGCNQQVTADEVDPPRKGLDADEIVSSRTPQTVPRKQLSRPSKTKLNDSSNSKSQNDDPSTTESQYQQRLDIVKRLATKLDLSLIPASDLSTTITDSKLMSTHDLYQAYRLQALNAERTKSKVFVEGAGLGEVNGTYLQRGVHEGTPMYNKEGVWEDREEVFRIFLCTYSNGNKSWCLSIVPKGKEPGKTTDLDFYECPVSYGVTGGSYSAENGVGVVPTKGWKLVKYGQLPMPNCSLIAGCLEDVP